MSIGGIRKWVKKEYGLDISKRSVRYLIKIDQPTAGGVLGATKADGSALATVSGVSGSIPWALEGDRVLLKIDLEDDYKLTAVYSDAGRTNPVMAENGKYYIIVPRGGGVSLSLVLEKVPAPPAPTMPDEVSVSDDSDSTSDPGSRQTRSLTDMIDKPVTDRHALWACLFPGIKTKSRAEPSPLLPVIVL